MRYFHHILIVFMLAALPLGLSAQVTYELVDDKQTPSDIVEFTAPLPRTGRDVTIKMANKAIDELGNNGLNPEMRAGIFFSEPKEYGIKLYRKVRDKSQCQLVDRQRKKVPYIYPIQAAANSEKAELTYTLTDGDIIREDFWLVVVLSLGNDTDASVAYDIRHYKRKANGKKKGGAEGNEEDDVQAPDMNGYWKFENITTDFLPQKADFKEGGSQENNLRYSLEWRGNCYFVISEVIGRYVEFYPDPNHPGEGGLYKVRHDHSVERAEGEFTVVTPPATIPCGQEIGIDVNYHLTTGCTYGQKFRSEGIICIGIILDDGKKITFAVPQNQNQKREEKAKANKSEHVQMAVDILESIGQKAASTTYDAEFHNNGDHETFVFTAPQGRVFTALDANMQKHYTTYQNMYIAVYYGRSGLVGAGGMPVAYYHYRYIPGIVDPGEEPEDSTMTHNDILTKYLDLLKDMTEWLNGENDIYGNHTPAKESAIISLIAAILALLTAGGAGGPDLWFNRPDPNAPDPETARLKELDRQQGEQWRKEQRAQWDAMNKAGYSYEAEQYKKDKKFYALAERLHVSTLYGKEHAKEQIRSIMKEKEEVERRISQGFVKQAEFWDKAVTVAEWTDSIATTTINIMGELDPTGSTRLIKNLYTVAHSVAGNWSEVYASGHGNFDNYINAINKGMFQGLIGVIQNQAGDQFKWATKYTTEGGFQVGTEMLKTVVSDACWGDLEYDEGTGKYMFKSKSWDRIIMDTTKAGLQKSVNVALGNYFQSTAKTEIVTDYVTNPLIGKSIDAVDQWVGNMASDMGDLYGDAEYFYSNPQLDWRCIYWED